jgi:hypothetical protein
MIIKSLYNNTDLSKSEASKIRENLGLRKSRLDPEDGRVEVEQDMPVRCQQKVSCGHGRFSRTSC